MDSSPPVPGLASSDRAGAAAALGAMVVLGSLFASADAIEAYPLAAGQAIRCTLAAIVLAIVARGALRILTVREFTLIVLLSVTGVIGYNIAIVLAVRESDPAVVGVIVSCLPVVVALVSPLFTRRLPSRKLLTAAVLVAAGAAAVQYTGGGTSATGVGLALAALGLEALFAFLAVPLLRQIKPVAVACYTCAIAVPICVAIALFAEDWGAIANPTHTEGLALLHLGLVVTPVSFALWYVAIEKLGVERASLFFGVLPVTVLATAAVIGGTPVTAVRILGIALVAAGIVLGMRVQRTGLATPAA